MTGAMSIPASATDWGFPDFSKFGLEPCRGGSLISVSAVDDDGGYLAGIFMAYPDGRIGGLTIGQMEGVDALDVGEIERLVELSCEGNWMLEGLKRTTRKGSYAQLLVIDALLALEGLAA